MIHDRRQPNRKAPTWRQLINPLWLLSDDERNGRWLWLSWFLRNPAANLFSTALGLCHRERDVTWRRGPGWTFVPVGGLNYGWSVAVGGWMPRPFISWRGSRIEVCAGWKTSRALGFDIRRASSNNAAETP